MIKAVFMASKWPTRGENGGGLNGWLLVDQQHLYCHFERGGKGKATPGSLDQRNPGDKQQQSH